MLVSSLTNKEGQARASSERGTFRSSMWCIQCDVGSKHPNINFIPGWKYTMLISKYVILNPGYLPLRMIGIKHCSVIIIIILFQRCQLHIFNVCVQNSIPPSLPIPSSQSEMCKRLQLVNYRQNQNKNKINISTIKWRYVIRGGTHPKEADQYSRANMLTT